MNIFINHPLYVSYSSLPNMRLWYYKNCDSKEITENVLFENIFFFKYIVETCTF
jgi:hypothetical protein